MFSAGGAPCSVVAYVHIEDGQPIRGLDVIADLETLDAIAKATGFRASDVHIITTLIDFPTIKDVWFVGRIRYWSSIAEVHERRNLHN